jgi:radical SAM superfamily enzyme YgiQ (UPF0313 family)
MLVRYHDKPFNTFIPAGIDKYFAQKIPPLGIAYIAANLRKHGHKVSILDCIALELSAQQTRSIILNEKPDIVGITTMTVSSQGALEAAKIAKGCGCKVVLGGPHLSIFPKETLHHPCVDYAIIGDGEYSMLELVNAIEEGKSPENIKGLIFCRDNNICVNPPDIIDELDELPLPAIDLLPLERYGLIGAAKPFATMLTMRGCPYDCGYCGNRVDPMRKVRFRKVDKVLDEMQLLVDKYGVKEINFVVETLTLNRDFIIQMCKGILERKINVKWQGPTRVDCVDIDLLQLMSKAGCRQLRYGIESGNQEILDLMNKRINLDMIERAITDTRKAGIKIVGYFILGYIRDNPTTIRKTINFAKRLKLDTAVFYPGTPYYKTKFYELAIEQGLVDPDYWPQWVLGKRTDRLPDMVPNVDKWVKRAFREFYYRPEYIIRHILNIRSFKELSEGFNAAKSLLALKVRHAAKEKECQ